MTNSPKNKFDTLKLFFGEPYTIDTPSKPITILQPTVGDILQFGENLEFGEKEFYQTLYTFILNPTSYRLQLWDNGIDWNKITDFDLFCIKYKTINPYASALLFGDIDFTAFELYGKKGEDDKQVKVLVNKSLGIEIYEETYNLIADYLRTMFNIFPKVEKTKGKTTKEWLIEEEREKLKTQNDENKSIMLPMVSFYLTHPGTSYKKDELKNVGIYEFMDGVKRLQIYESTSALYKGMYSGMINTKDVDKQSLDFMRDL